VLNEQEFLREILDSEGLKLNYEEIGGWDGVTAISAKITNKQDRIVFSLKTVEGPMLRQGREMFESSLNCIGLYYKLSSEDERFKCEIEIFG
jgi:hypothetical protein